MSSDSRDEMSSSEDSDHQSTAKVVVVKHASSADHIGPARHPESPERLSAVTAALADDRIAPSLIEITARRASDPELERAHDRHYVERVRAHIESGGTRLDQDTFTSAGSLEASLHAAGAGLTAVEYLDEHTHLEGAFVAVRPPGHHATPNQAMGFCLFNNIAVTAAALADRGERVLIIDWDVHHGNGTQDIFWNDPRVSFVSLHEANLYPFSGRTEERGGIDALGTNTNLALPSGATGDVYRSAFDQVIEPIAEEFGPSWVLVSAGFDAHHDDPLSDMALTSGDYEGFTTRARAIAPGTARTLLFLEGGYGLAGLRDSVRSSVASLANVEIQDEEPSAGGPGSDLVAEVSEVVRNRR